MGGQVVDEGGDIDIVVEVLEARGEAEARIQAGDQLCQVGIVGIVRILFL